MKLGVWEYFVIPKLVTVHVGARKKQDDIFLQPFNINIKRVKS